LALLAHSNCIVVADSYYASVQAALRLKTIGMRFIGTIKTATKGFPMRALASKVLVEGKGARFGLLSTDHESGTDLLAFVSIDRDRCYFISTCSSLTPGNPCIRHRWRQDDRTANADANYKEVVVRQPEACELYYGPCGKIDLHNRFRQASLLLERKLANTAWDQRVNTTLFGMCVVDAYLLQVWDAKVSCVTRRQVTSSFSWLKN
jgi:Transposase IS4